MNRTWVAILLGSLSLVGCASAPKGGAIAIPKVVPYAEGVGSPAIRKECVWNSELTGYIAANAKRGTVVIVKDLSAATGKVLTMTITNVHAIPGGRVSGPKWGTLDGELRNDGRLIGSFKASRNTTSGGFGACANLDRVGEALGKDIALWLKAPIMDARLGDEK